MPHLKGVLFITEGGGLGQQANLQGEAFDIPWDDAALEARFPALVVDNKDRCQLWSAAEYKAGAKRGKDGIVCLHAVVLDADYCDIGTAAKMSEHLMRTKQAALLYTGFSHMNPSKVHEDTGIKGPFDSFRIVLPVSRPILPAEYAYVVAAVFSTQIVPGDPPHYADEVLGKKILVNPALNKYRPARARGWDRASYRYSQGWFVPACPASRQKHAAFEVYQGKVLDVDALVGMRIDPPTSEALPAEARGDIGGATEGAINQFGLFVQAMEAAGIPCRGASPLAQNRSMCPCCQKQPHSFSFTVQGDRVVFNCFRECSYTDVLESLGIEGDTLTDPAVGEDARDFMQHVTLMLGESPARGELPAGDIEEAIRRAFGTDRSTPYTKEEIASMEPVRKRWVLATPAGNFIREPGGDYLGPIQDKLVPVKCRDVLSPASTADVILVKYDKQMERSPKTLSEILDQYGQVPSQMSYSYLVPKSVLTGNTFVQKAARTRPFEPVFHPKIDHWLGLFGGEMAEPLRDWLATVLDLGRPTCAPCIMGQSGAGKDLFADGLTQLWGTRIEFHNALGTFNGELIRSPLVFANEEVRGPQGFKGSVAEALKDMISSDVRKVEAKYAHPVDLNGCLRVILATNAHGMLNFQRQPTEADIQALDDRILLLRPTPETRQFLIDIGGRDTTETWVRGGQFAEHVMWLRANRKVQPGPRFLVQGQGGMSTVLAADGIGAAAVLTALLRALLGPMETNKKVVHRDEEGSVWVSMAKLKEEWAKYGGKDPVEDMQGIFNVICEPNTAKARKVAGEPIKMRKLRLAVLLRAAKNDGDETLDKLITST